MAYEYLATARNGSVERLTLNRPDVRNAFNEHVIAELPAPVIGRIHGAALGGGAGLAAVCDIVVAAEDALFGFTETRLGIIPAVISPFVLNKIGPSAARELFVTG